MPAIEGGARIFPAPFPRDARTVLSSSGSADTIGSLKAYNAGVFLVRGAARAAHACGSPNVPYFTRLEFYFETSYEKIHFSENLH